MIKPDEKWPRGELPEPPPMRTVSDAPAGTAIMDLICVVTILLAGVLIGWVMRGGV